MSRSRKIAFLIFVLILCIINVACSLNEKKENDLEDGPDNYSIDNREELYTVVDDFDRVIKLDEAPKRIISLAPSSTEIICALGLADNIVGVTIFDDYPEKVIEIEKVEDLSGIDLDRIIELNPDLVIDYGSGNEEENLKLEEAGIKYAGFNPKFIDDILDTIDTIGKLTGKVAEAKKLINTMNTKKDEVLSRIKDIEPKRVFYEVWHEPLMTAGPGTLIDELIILAGGDNIARDIEEEYPQFDLEQLTLRNPQVYLALEDMPEKTAESIALRPGYENIDAIINGNVYLLNENIVLRPGPRIVDALELIAKAIHPEEF
jgi:iron complex transport system substrate-binding protein